VELDEFHGMYSFKCHHVEENLRSCSKTENQVHKVRSSAAAGPAGRAVYLDIIMLNRDPSANNPATATSPPPKTGLSPRLIGCGGSQAVQMSDAVGFMITEFVGACSSK